MSDAENNQADGTIHGADTKENLRRALTAAAELGDAASSAEAAAVLIEVLSAFADLIRMPTVELAVGQLACVTPEVTALHAVLIGVIERHADDGEAGLKARAESVARAFKAGLAAFDSATKPMQPSPPQ